MFVIQGDILARADAFVDDDIANLETGQLVALYQRLPRPGERLFIGVFQEAFIRAPLPLGVHSAAVVNQNFHSELSTWGSVCKLRKIREKYNEIKDYFMLSTFFVIFANKGSKYQV